MVLRGWREVNLVQRVIDPGLTNGDEGGGVLLSFLMRTLGYGTTTTTTTTTSSSSITVAGCPRPADKVTILIQVPTISTTT